MKKLYAVIFFAILSLLLWYQGEKSEFVFKEDILDYNNQTSFISKKIDVSNAAITTKNITSLLDGITLRMITYEIPKLYLSKFADYNFEYFLSYGSLSNLENQISNRFQELGQRKEVEKIYFYGLKLVSIEVYGTISEIEAFENKIKP